jgi:hypothetical protein
MQASKQWASRPNDERFASLTELNAHCQAIKLSSKATVVPSRAIRCEPLVGDNAGLMVAGPNGGQVALTHWSFGQLAQRVAAPAGYLRSLPAPMAADCINYGLYHRDVEDIGVLLYKNGGPAQMRAVTGPAYGRIWNSTVTQALVDRFGDGITGDFRVPGEFGKHVDVTRENTTLYASDRDMFVFLADENRRIEIPNRRDGRPGSLARGFFVWISTFLFDYVCSNRIVWGATQYKGVRIRHTASGAMRWIDEVAPAIEQYANSSTTSVVQAIEGARKARIDNLDDFLAKRFSRGQVSAIKAAHQSDEQRPMETLWDVATGVTAYARSVQYQDQRVDLEREAGKILDMAA